MSNQSLRRFVFTHLSRTELSLIPPAPWYYEADPRLSQKIKDATAYRVATTFQCDVPTCGYRGRYAFVAFPPRRDGKVEWTTSIAGTIIRLLEEPDLSVPSQADYSALSMMFVGGKEGGGYAALQLDEGDDERAKAMLKAIIDRWHQAWDKCRAEKRCPPEKHPH